MKRIDNKNIVDELIFLKDEIKIENYKMKLYLIIY
jgi:hypothetical protein